MSRYLKFLVLPATLLLAIGALATADEPSQPIVFPRYRFEVGQEITYEAATEHNNNALGDSNLVQSMWRVSVVRQNTDGTWHVVVQKSNKSLNGSYIQICVCDVSDTGHITNHQVLGYSIDPADVVVALPTDADEHQHGWKTIDPTTGNSRTNRVLPKSKGRTDMIEVQQSTPLDVIYDVTNRSTLQFDRNRGLVTQVEAESSQGWGIVGTSSTLIELKSVEMKDPTWARTLDHDAQLYFDTLEKYNGVLKCAGRETANTDKLSNEALALLNSAEPKFAKTLFHDELTRKIQLHDSAAKSAQEQAEWYGQLVGQPSPDWEATDFDGKTHSMGQYRGKVVILDFWYRGCGFCIKDMPQVKQVVESFQGQPVVVLGMNTDRNDDDARFVIEKMSLNYPSLKAKEIAEKYNVEGFPTTIVIDQDGVVRDVYVGASPTLLADVSAAVSQLLKRPK